MLWKTHSFSSAQVEDTPSDEHHAPLKEDEAKGVEAAPESQPDEKGALPEAGKEGPFSRLLF